jgi:hypothetical protein
MARSRSVGIVKIAEFELQQSGCVPQTSRTMKN